MLARQPQLSGVVRLSNCYFQTNAGYCTPFKLILAAVLLAAQVPGEFAVVGQSRADLLHALMIPAHDLLEELVAHAASAGQRQQQQQNGSDAAGAAAANGRMLQPREMLVLHLMHMVGAPPGSRLLASENAKVSMLIEMLEGGQAGIGNIRLAVP